MRSTKNGDNELREFLQRELVREVRELASSATYAAEMFEQREFLNNTTITDIAHRRVLVKQLNESIMWLAMIHKEKEKGEEVYDMI
jgi:hypothetical protein